jgi:hypothetical protein
VITTVSAFSQNYEISLTVKNGKNSTVYFGHFFAKSDVMYLDDSLVLKNGKGVLRGNKRLEKGLYFLVNDRKVRQFDIIIGDNQQFGIVTDTADFVNQTKFTSSPDNDVFFEFQHFHFDCTKRYEQLYEQLKNAVSDEEKNALRTQLQKLTDERLDFIEKLVNDNSNLYISKFLKTFVPIEKYVPEPPKDADGNITNREFQYRWWRTHFFDNLNIYDPEMLRIPYYEEKVMSYITRVVPQMTDTICAEIDKILTEAKANDDVFRCVLVLFYNHYNDQMKKLVVDKGVVPENVWVHIVDKWYVPFAFFSTEENRENLKQEVDKRKPNLIGKHTPPIEMMMVLPTEHFKAAARDTAIKYDLHAGIMLQDFRNNRRFRNKFTILFFWDYSCGHCKQNIQELFTFWEEIKSKGVDVQVFAVQTVIGKSEKGKWIDFINDKELYGWINAWSPYSYRYKELYNFTSVPVFYLLDDKFNIIIRGIPIETLKEFFNNQLSVQ